jgi:hypothetical protein
MLALDDDLVLRRRVAQIDPTVFSTFEALKRSPPMSLN